MPTTSNASFNSTEYTYDNNGNLISDLNKNMVVSAYNYLNLPQQINIGSGIGHAINFLYTATGQKLRKKTDDDAPTDYNASFVYEDGVAVYILTPEGRIMIDNNSYEYQYFLKDHLGNTRITLSQNGGIVQEDAYYPFGMQMSGLSQQNGTDMPNKYLYNGKELQDDFDLDWYDYGARFYDAQIGRWHVVDPLADDAPSWSPYNAMWNNPILNVDSDGCWANPVYGSDGTYKGDTKEGFTGEVIIYDGDKDFSGMSASELLYNESFDVKTQKGEANTYNIVRNELTGESKSKIWTHIASKMEGQQIYDETVSMSDLTGGKIHYDGNVNGSWTSSYALGTGKGKITGSDKYSYETTVENIQSSIAVHEYYSHIKKNQGDRYSSHRLAYKNVINYKALWNKTTDAYKGFNMRLLLKYTKSETGRTKVDPLYRNLYKKFKDKR
jgi:RHS repeat-associated protein